MGSANDPVVALLEDALRLPPDDFFMGLYTFALRDKLGINSVIDLQDAVKDRGDGRGGFLTEADLIRHRFTPMHARKLLAFASRMAMIEGHAKQPSEPSSTAPPPITTAKASASNGEPASKDVRRQQQQQQDELDISCQEVETPTENSPHSRTSLVTDVSLESAVSVELHTYGGYAPSTWQDLVDNAPEKSPGGQRRSNQDANNGSPSKQPAQDKPPTFASNGIDARSAAAPVALTSSPPKESPARAQPPDRRGDDDNNRNYQRHDGYAREGRPTNRPDQQPSSAYSSNMRESVPPADRKDYDRQPRSYSQAKQPLMEEDGRMRPVVQPASASSQAYQSSSYRLDFDQMLPEEERPSTRDEIKDERLLRPDEMESRWHQYHDHYPSDARSPPKEPAQYSDAPARQAPFGGDAERRDGRHDEGERLPQSYGPADYDGRCDVRDRPVSAPIADRVYSSSWTRQDELRREENRPRGQQHGFSESGRQQRCIDYDSRSWGPDGRDGRPVRQPREQPSPSYGSSRPFTSQSYSPAPRWKESYGNGSPYGQSSPMLRSDRREERERGSSERYPPSPIGYDRGPYLAEREERRREGEERKRHYDPFSRSRSPERAERGRLQEQESLWHRYHDHYPEDDDGSPSRWSSHHGDDRREFGDPDPERHDYDGRPRSRDRTPPAPTRGYRSSPPISQEQPFERGTYRREDRQIEDDSPMHCPRSHEEEEARPAYEENESLWHQYHDHYPDDDRRGREHQPRRYDQAERMQRADRKQRSRSPFPSSGSYSLSPPRHQIDQRLGDLHDRDRGRLVPQGRSFNSKEERRRLEEGHQYHDHYPSDDYPAPREARFNRPASAGIGEYSRYPRGNGRPQQGRPHSAFPSSGGYPPSPSRGEEMRQRSSKHDDGQYTMGKHRHPDEARARSHPKNEEHRRREERESPWHQMHDHYPSARECSDAPYSSAGADKKVGYPSHEQRESPWHQMHDHYPSDDEGPSREFDQHHHRAGADKGEEYARVEEHESLWHQMHDHYPSARDHDDDDDDDDYSPSDYRQPRPHSQAASRPQRDDSRQRPHSAFASRRGYPSASTWQDVDQRLGDMNERHDTFKGQDRSQGFINRDDKRRLEESHSLWHQYHDHYPSDDQPKQPYSYDNGPARQPQYDAPPYAEKKDSRRVARDPAKDVPSPIRQVLERSSPTKERPQSAAYPSSRGYAPSSSFPDRGQQLPELDRRHAAVDRRVYLNRSVPLERQSKSDDPPPRIHQQGLPHESKWHQYHDHYPWENDHPSGQAGSQYPSSSYGQSAKESSGLSVAQRKDNDRRPTSPKQLPKREQKESSSCLPYKDKTWSAFPTTKPVQEEPMRQQTVQQRPIQGLPRHIDDAASQSTLPKFTKDRPSSAKIVSPAPSRPSSGVPPTENKAHGGLEEEQEAMEAQLPDGALRDVVGTIYRGCYMVHSHVPGSLGRSPMKGGPLLDVSPITSPDDHVILKPVVSRETLDYELSIYRHLLERESNACQPLLDTLPVHGRSPACLVLAGADETLAHELKMGELDPIRLAEGLIEALDDLHSHRVMHGDLKPSSILISRGLGRSVDVRLIDFDCSRLCLAPGQIPLELCHQNTTDATVQYAAPEVILASSGGTGLCANLSADMFSMGLILAEVFSHPYRPVRTLDMDVRKEAAEGQEAFFARHARLLSVPTYPWLAPILARLCSFDPSSRMSARELMMRWNSATIARLMNNQPEYEMTRPIKGNNRSRPSTSTRDYDAPQPKNAQAMDHRSQFKKVVEEDSMTKLLKLIKDQPRATMQLLQSLQGFDAPRLLLLLPEELMSTTSKKDLTWACRSWAQERLENIDLDYGSGLYRLFILDEGPSLLKDDDPLVPVGHGLCVDMPDSLLVELAPIFAILAKLAAALRPVPNTRTMRPLLSDGGSLHEVAKFYEEVARADDSLARNNDVVAAMLEALERSSGDRWGNPGGSKDHDSYETRHNLQSSMSYFFRAISGLLQAPDVHHQWRTLTNPFNGQLKQLWDTLDSCYRWVSSGYYRRCLGPEGGGRFARDEMSRPHRTGPGSTITGSSTTWSSTKDGPGSLPQITPTPNNTMNLGSFNVTTTTTIHSPGRSGLRQESTSSYMKTEPCPAEVASRLQTVTVSRRGEGNNDFIPNFGTDSNIPRIGLESQGRLVGDIPHQRLNTASTTSSIRSEPTKSANLSARKAPSPLPDLTASLPQLTSSTCSVGGTSVKQQEPPRLNRLQPTPFQRPPLQPTSTTTSQKPQPQAQPQQPSTASTTSEPSLQRPAPIKQPSNKSVTLGLQPIQQQSPPQASPKQHYQQQQQQQLQLQQRDQPSPVPPSLLQQQQQQPQQPPQSGSVAHPMIYEPVSINDLLYELQHISTNNPVTSTRLLAACGLAGKPHVDTAEALVALLRRPDLPSNVIATVLAAISHMTEVSGANKMSLQSRLGALGACKEVVVCLKEFPTDLQVQCLGCNAIVSLAEDFPENEKVLHQAGAGQAVVAAMTSFPSTREVQYMGCRAISTLAASEHDGEPSLGQAGAGQRVVTALASFLTDRDIQVQGCWAIANLALSEKGNDSLLVRIGGMDVVTASMKAFPTDRDVQFNGLGALVNLTSTVENRKLVGRSGGSERVLAAMAAFPDDRHVQHHGCWAISNLAAVEQNSTQLGRMAACEKVVASMKGFQSDHGVLMEAIRAIAALADGNDENTARLAKSGACGRVVLAMTTFGHDPALQQEGIKAIASLADGSQDNINELGKLGACEKVLLAMGGFHNNVQIQQEGCCAIANLATVHAARLGSQACERVMAAMTAFPSNKDIQEEACCATFNLASDEKNCALLGESGACEKVVKALQSFPSEMQVQSWACSAVIALAHNEVNIPRLGAAGACEAILFILRNYTKESQLQHQGCSAIFRLAATTENAVRFGEAGACELVTSALKSFKNDLQVQSWATCAIVNLAGNCKENTDRLGNAGACVEVYRAMEQFPNDRDIQSWCCCAMANLSGGNAQNASKLAEIGAMTQVLRSMKSYQSAQQVQCWGSSVIAELAMDNKKKSENIGNMGGCEAVLTAMTAFRDDPQTGLECCRAIANLADDNLHNVERLLSVGACEEVVLAMRSFAAERDLQVECCRAIFNLSIDDQSASRLGRAGACESVMTTMRTFPTDQEVQYEAINAIVNLAIDDNIERLRRLGAREAAQSVLKTYPDLVEDAQRAIDILT